MQRNEVMGKASTDALGSEHEKSRVGHILPQYYHDSHVPLLPNHLKSGLAVSDLWSGTIFFDRELILSTGISLVVMGRM
jgi:hypothetical protein